VTDVDTYLASVAAQVHGAGAARLSAELRDHLEDAIAHHVAAGFDQTDATHLALERFGATEEVVVAWNAQARTHRVQARRRAALVAFAAVTASALALVQHASGRQPSDSVSPATVTSRCAPSPRAPQSPFFLSTVGRMALAVPSGAIDDLAGGRRSGANPFRCKRR
jgi:hypothetical protein